MKGGGGTFPDRDEQAEKAIVSDTYHSLIGPNWPELSQ